MCFDHILSCFSCKYFENGSIKWISKSCATADFSDADLFSHKSIFLRCQDDFWTSSHVHIEINKNMFEYPMNINNMKGYYERTTNSTFISSILLMIFVYKVQLQLNRINSIEIFDYGKKMTFSDLEILKFKSFFCL